MRDRTNAKGVQRLDRSRRRPVACESGQTLVEYALILATVAIGVITTIVILKGKLDDVFSVITQAV